MSINVRKLLVSGRFFFVALQVDFYFKIPNPEIRNQMLMIVASRPRFFC